jgi:hypothetical protein
MVGTHFGNKLSPKSSNRCKFSTNNYIWKCESTMLYQIWQFLFQWTRYYLICPSNLCPPKMRFLASAKSQSENVIYKSGECFFWLSSILTFMWMNLSFHPCLGLPFNRLHCFCHNFGCKSKTKVQTTGIHNKFFWTFILSFFFFLFRNSSWKSFEIPKSQPCQTHVYCD